MRRMRVLALWFVMLLLSTAMARAGRPNEKRETASYIFSGKVMAVYATGYLGPKDNPSRDFIVEIKVDEVTKGERLKKGDTFRAYCYQNKSPQPFETRGHTRVPEAGQRIRAYVNDGRGRNEGVYPDWFDVLPKTGK